MMRFGLGDKPIWKRDNPSFVRLLELANIGRRFWDVSLDPISDRLHYKAEVQAYIRDFARNERSGLGVFLTGPLGSGKTSILSLLMIEAMLRAPITAYFMPVLSLDWCSRHRSEMRTSNGTTIWSLLTEAQIVGLDDLCSERDAEWTAAGVEEVLRARYNARLVTFLSTNKSPEDVFARLPWLGSLVKEVYRTIRVEGRNWRG
jgi:DNA replication protein DnaC